jgi:hypothetical protein
MGSLYLKGSKLWARYKKRAGQVEGRSHFLPPGDGVKARRFLKGLEAESEAKGDFARRNGESKGPITVAD